MNVEENKDPNLTANCEALDGKAKSALTAKNNKASDANTLQVLAAGVVSSMGNAAESQFAPRPPLAARSPAVAAIEDAWVRLDELRVRMEMLPGGLVIERDTSISDVAAMMNELQSETACEQMLGWQAETTSKIMQITTIVDAVEAEYWRWCADADAFPIDIMAKQQVYDWLVTAGEREVALTQLRSLGARRCIGSASSPLASGGRACPKFLQYGLYKANVKRCPACAKESKRLVAISASQAVRQSLADVSTAGQISGASGKTKCLAFNDSLPATIPVESRELAFAVYAGCPNTYFRAFVLPSDLEIARETGSPVTVSWLDGDRKHRLVPTNTVVMMDHPSASDVRFANSAHWNEDAQRLVAGTAS